MFERFVAPHHLYGSLSVSVNNGGMKKELTFFSVHFARKFLYLL
jgi:hypothetical protein